jgi:23S rRNA-/tRNA-specific pseudouridylate synthase
MKSNEKYSLVSCFPLTGRTHQIRVHLKWLGHPIANDPCYGKDVPTNFVTIDSEGNTNDFYEEILQNKIDLINSNFKDNVSENKDDFYEKDPHCTFCTLHIPDPKIENLFLYLHAYNYSCKEESFPFSFTTEMPDWVKLAD